MQTQMWIGLGTVAVLAGLGFMLSISIKRHEAKRKAEKKKKGRNRHMPLYRGPGK